MDARLTTVTTVDPDRRLPGLPFVLTPSLSPTITPTSTSTPPYINMSPHVLRFDRSDQKDSFVLVHLVNNGSPSLNLTLTATEGEGAYTASVKESSLKDLRSKSYQGSDDEWTQVIRRILGQSTKDENETTSSFKLEATASITESDDENGIVITIRKRVQDITQRLGTITLKQSEAEIELFEWAGTAAARNRALEQETSTLNARYQEAANTVQKLTQQLEDLVQAKAQHENQLMTNFTQLLNEKKLKIRNQQRLLASATADPDKVSEIQASAMQFNQSSESPRLAKRGHGNTTDEESDDFEPMDIDQKKTGKLTAAAEADPHDQDTDEGGNSTPPPGDDGNTTTDDESGEEQEQKPDLKQKRPSAPKAKEAAPPPRRELPFNRRGAATAPKAATPPPPPPAGDETGERLMMMSFS
ncbi:DNA double-strand break repair and VJ recombination XRCC4 C-terminal [Penicillium cosmopolitanum]|uniref:DNA double-strand break repair and VJ recombination XRCC4 C-terminal n=1 Tax=Penicillium cosmopolitanum TaxID=1131564 RepID=A0A9X0BBU7_9EURO|nr:DNA double-strand break repair and VJ recombination XRCC4 C-terminal [Penicillium cosmopolitanum]KAJ5404080.1 DNA double-strand break repair and VJ recombination XRCC4 C-terminal [Penicillium cosmopolitanum]